MKTLMMTPNEAKKITRELCRTIGFDYERMTARTVGFTDLARHGVAGDSCIYVRIFGWSKNSPDAIHRFADVSATAKSRGFVTSLAGDFL